MRKIDHNCKEVKAQIELYLDGELDRYSQMKVDEVVESCPICKNEFNNQSSLKKMIHVGLQRVECSPQMRMRIINKIRGL